MCLGAMDNPREADTEWVVAARVQCGPYINKYDPVSWGISIAIALVRNETDRGEGKRESIFLLELLA